MFVAAGREAFQPMEYKIKRVAIADDKGGGQHFVALISNKNFDGFFCLYLDQASGQGNADLSKERTPKELKKTSMYLIEKGL